MPLVGFEPTISAGERPKTYSLDRVATWTGLLSMWGSESAQVSCLTLTCTRDSGLVLHTLIVYFTI